MSDVSDARAVKIYRQRGVILPGHQRTIARYIDDTTEQPNE